MQELYLELSGNVPGGFLLLTFILVAINLALYYLYKSSKLFDRPTYRRKAIRFNVSLIAFYVFLWFYLQPPALPSRVAFLPWQNGDSIDVDIAQTLQFAAQKSEDSEYLLHRWEWFVETADLDSLNSATYLERLAEKLNIDTYVSGRITNENGIKNCSILLNDNGSIETAEFKYSDFGLLINQMQEFIRDHSDILTAVTPTDYSSARIKLITTTKLNFMRRNFQSGLSLPDDQGLEVDILKARAYIQTGRQEQTPKNKTNLQTVDINTTFQKAQALLIPYSKTEEDNAELNVALARLYMHIGDYETAEVCLKRAYTQDRFDARVLFLMSFLHHSRFSDLGFTDRKEILEKTVSLDPGYADAVFELANEYYNTGTGTPSGYSTNYARNLLLKYLEINERKYPILNLLGKIYLQTKFTREAKEIFEKLLALYPDSSEANYNLGVSYFQLKEYDKAEPLFQKAVAISDDLDSYLYLGAIYKERGELDIALEYFRDRIRRKTGNDDYYAKEAMRQVRIILSIQSGDTLQSSENENQNSGAL